MKLLPFNISSVAEFHDRVARRLLREGVDYANQRSRFFATYHERPKLARDVGTWPDLETRREPSAIVMQGPVATKDDFTFETLKLYRRNMPEAKLILSTWKDTPREHVDQAESLGVEVVLSDKPEVPALYNINMQLVSASAGVRRALEHGVEWVIKTRTDQRMYEPNVMAFLVATAKAFPVTGGWDQKYRIIGIGQGSLKFLPYHVTDQTVFGHAEDMVRYWTPPLLLDPPPAHWPKTPLEIYETVQLRELCQTATPECFFASHFLKRTGRELSWSIEQSWSAYRDQFCFVDYASTDLYWVKSQSFTKREHTSTYEHIWNRHEIDFREWLMLYTGALPLEAARRYEHVLEGRFRDAIEPESVAAVASAVASSYA